MCLYVSIFIVIFQSGTTATVDSDSSDEEVKQPKVKSSRRRGLAARLAKKENYQPVEGEISEQSAVYSTLVAKVFRSQVQQIPAVVTIDQTNSGNYRPGRHSTERLKLSVALSRESTTFAPGFLTPSYSVTHVAIQNSQG